MARRERGDVSAYSIYIQKLFSLDEFPIAQKGAILEASPARVSNTASLKYEWWRGHGNDVVG